MLTDAFQRQHRKKLPTSICMVFHAYACCFVCAVQCWTRQNVQQLTHHDRVCSVQLTAIGSSSSPLAALADFAALATTRLQAAQIEKPW